jgi:hypothetical protein
LAQQVRAQPTAAVADAHAGEVVARGCVGDLVERRVRRVLGAVVGDDRCGRWERRRPRAVQQVGPPAFSAERINQGDLDDRVARGWPDVAVRAVARVLGHEYQLISVPECGLGRSVDDQFAPAVALIDLEGNRDRLPILDAAQSQIARLPVGQRAEARGSENDRVVDSRQGLAGPTRMRGRRAGCDQQRRAPRPHDPSAAHCEWPIACGDENRYSAHTHCLAPVRQQGALNARADTAGACRRCGSGIACALLRRCDGFDAWPRGNPRTRCPNGRWSGQRCTAGSCLA